MVSQKSKHVNSIIHIYMYIPFRSGIGRHRSPSHSKPLDRSCIVLRRASRGLYRFTGNSSLGNHFQGQTHTHTHTLEHANTYAYTQARASITHCATTATATRFTLYLLYLLGT